MAPVVAHVKSLKCSGRSSKVRMGAWRAERSQQRLGHHVDPCRSGFLVEGRARKCEEQDVHPGYEGHRVEERPSADKARRSLSGRSRQRRSHRPRLDSMRPSFTRRLARLLSPHHLADVSIGRRRRRGGRRRGTSATRQDPTRHQRQALRHLEPSADPRRSRPVV